MHRGDLSADLNQYLRRLRQYQTESDWVSALLDGASHLVHQAAVLSLQDGALWLRGQRNLSLPEDLTVPVRSAGAFAAAIDSKDPVIALRTPAEVTEFFSTPEPGDRAHIIPIVNGTRPVAVLFASDDGQFDVNALELVTGMASIVLERQSNQSLHAQIAAPPTRALANSPLRTLAGMSEEERAHHLRARRFARVAVAEMQLSRPEACRAGREQGNVYLFSKNEVDKARDTYRERFMTTPSMVDYLHLELVRTAAEGDELKLGADYPGQLA